MKTISYIKHLHKAIFIVLLILALAACGDGPPPAPTPGGDGGGGNPGGGGGAGEPLNTIVLTLGANDATRVKTYVNGRNGLQRTGVATYPNQLEEESVVIGIALGASNELKAELRRLADIEAPFPIAAIFNKATNRKPMLADTNNLASVLNVLYNEETGEVKFSIEVRNDMPLGDIIADFSTPEQTFNFNRMTGASSPALRLLNAVYKIALDKEATDRTLDSFETAGLVTFTLPDPELIGGDMWYIVGEIDKDSQCSNAARVSMECCPGATSLCEQSCPGFCE